MQEIYNYNQIKLLESQILKDQGMTEEELRAQKSNAFCMQFKKDFFGRQRIILFAGPNDNGALGLRIATTLASLSHDIMVVLLNPTGTLPDEVIHERDNFKASFEEHLMEVTTQFAPPMINEEDIIVDAICGTEQQSPLTGSVPNVIRYLNSLVATKISVDIPSGLLETDNRDNDYSKVFSAQLTYTFYNPKLSFLFKENSGFVGLWTVMNIGIHLPESSEESDYQFFGSLDMEQAIPKRSRYSNKYDFGKVLLIAGSKGMIGASILAGKAATYSGAGHVTLHIPQGYEGAIHAALPEVLVSSDASNAHLTNTNLDIKEYDAIAIGPGLGRSKESELALEQLLKRCECPIILDADALNIIAFSEKELLNHIPKGSILTPHEGEFDRLFGASASSFERLELAKQIAQEKQINILLKGAYSATCSTNGKVFINTSGNPGLATAGTGDVLTGIILALLGKGHSPQSACCIAAFIHGFAADLYASSFCQESLTASQLIEQIPIALKRYKNDCEQPFYY